MKREKTKERQVKRMKGRKERKKEKRNITKEGEEEEGLHYKDFLDILYKQRGDAVAVPFFL